MPRLVACVLTVLGALLLLASAALAHPERPSRFPDWPGRVPAFRNTGEPHIVCKASTEQRIAQFTGQLRARNETLLDRCRYRHIQ
jgi:hypothetical protein